MTNESFKKTVSFAFLLKASGAFLGFLMNFLIAKSLDSANAGLFFLAFTICTSVATLSTLGLPLAFVRYIGSYHKVGQRSIIKGIFISGIRASAIVSTAIAIGIFVMDDLISEVVFSKPELSMFIKGMSLSIPMITCYLLVSYAFQGIQKTSVSIFFQNIISQILFVIPVGFCLWLGIMLDASSIVGVFTFVACFTCVLAILRWSREAFRGVDAQYDSSSNLFSSAKQLWITMLMATLVQYSGQITTGIFLSANDVAYFSVAQRVAMLAGFVLMAVNTIAAPRFASVGDNFNIDELRLLAQKSSRIMVTIACPILIILMIFPKEVLGLFGDEYRSADSILRILAVGNFINVITGSVGNLLIMTGYEKDMKNIVLLSGPLAVLASLVLTPVYGLIGAAIATGLALSCQNILAFYMVKKRLGINTLAFLSR